MCVCGCVCVMDEYKTEKRYINAYWQIPVPYGRELHLPPISYHLLAAQQESYQEICEFFGKKSEEWTISIKITR